MILHFMTKDPVTVPEWVVDLDSFRRWAHSDDFPHQGRFSHLGGRLWVDLSMEKSAHNLVKGQIDSVLTLLVGEQSSGRVFHDRMRLTCEEAELSTEPDGMFVSYEALDEGRITMVESKDATELLGGPDMVLEVVSDSSEEKDLVVLRDLYWRAGVREYWIVDPRGPNLLFTILRYTARGFRAVKSVAGWVKSQVFGKSFRLTGSTDSRGLPAYRLEVR